MSTEDPETGSALREKLEAALAENKTLKESNVSLTAEKVIRDEGLKYVKASDLVGVTPAEMVAKATELETAKTTERETLLREVLAEKGVAEDQLEGAIAKLGQQAGDDDAASRVASLGSLQGERPKPSFEGLHGPELLEAAFKASK